MVVGVPTHYVVLSNYDFPRMTTFFYSGAAALPKEVAENFEKKVGVPMGEGWGMTECNAAATINISAIYKIVDSSKI